MRWERSPGNGLPARNAKTAVAASAKRGVVCLTGSTFHSGYNDQKGWLLLWGFTGDGWELLASEHLDGEVVAVALTEHPSHGLTAFAAVERGEVRLGAWRIAGDRFEELSLKGAKPELDRDERLIAVCDGAGSRLILATPTKIFSLDGAALAEVPGPDLGSLTGGCWDPVGKRVLLADADGFLVVGKEGATRLETRPKDRSWWGFPPLAFVPPEKKIFAMVGQDEREAYWVSGDRAEKSKLPLPVLYRGGITWDVKRALLVIVGVGRGDEVRTWTLDPKGALTRVEDGRGASHGTLVPGPGVRQVAGRTGEVFLREGGQWRLLSSREVGSKKPDEIFGEGGSQEAPGLSRAPDGPIFGLTQGGKLVVLAEDGTWSKPKATSGPAPRKRPAFVAMRKGALLFGGQNEKGRPLDDSWWFDGKAWKEIKLKKKPSPREGAFAVAFEGGSKVLLWGGQGAKYKQLEDAWIFDGATWTPAAKPPANMRVAWHEPASGVVFGLVPDEPPVLSAWDGKAWTELADVPEAPSPIEGPNIPSESFYSGYAGPENWSFDTQTRRLVMVEGAAFHTTSELPIGELLDKAPKPTVAPAKGGKAAPAKQPPSSAFRKAWAIEIAKGKSDETAGGDRVTGIEAWPVCRTCKTPLSLVATLHRDAARLPLTHEGIAIFLCTDPKICESWKPLIGTNEVLFLEGKKEAVRSKAHGLLPDRALSFRTYVEIDPEAEIESSLARKEEEPAASKLGGFPRWVQEEETPKCPRCKKPMTFRVQLASPLVEVGDVGVAYVFVCPDEHRAAVLWQGA